MVQTVYYSLITSEPILMRTASDLVTNALHAAVLLLLTAEILSFTDSGLAR